MTSDDMCMVSHLEIQGASAKSTDIWVYGVATISRLLKIIGLFCKRALSKRLYSAKET